MPRFAELQANAADWVTLSSGQFYPDVVPAAAAKYSPIIARFTTLARAAKDSEALFRAIGAEPDSWTRVQLARVFRKYVAPTLPVEMTKKKSATDQICTTFGKDFRPIKEVVNALASRPSPDEALCALLWEYQDRGQKGYDLTEAFFTYFEQSFAKLKITGPKRAGKDILMGSCIPGYPKEDRPIDFLIKDGDTILAIGLARYDSDRGGSQEDDRVGTYRDVATEFLAHAAKPPLDRVKIIYLNDGPGLLLGSMWSDYGRLEAMHPDRIMVLTMKMVPFRLTEKWLRS